MFRRFEKDGEFFCLPGQSTQAVTGMYNLSRATHLSYPGEEILLDARKFSVKYLQERRALNKLTDKWIVTKDLPGEVAYALDFPWYASLPRVEARFYLEQYGGEKDVWIGKTLYRLHSLSFLKLEIFTRFQCLCDIATDRETELGCLTSTTTTSWSLLGWTSTGASHSTSLSGLTWRGQTCISLIWNPRYTANTVIE